MMGALNGLNFIYGVIFNTLTISICFRKRLRQMATFIILAYLAFSNLLGLFGYPLHSFLGNVLDMNLKNSSSFWCKLIVTITAFTFEWTIWLLALASFEMYLTLKIENLRLRYSNTRNTIIICLLLGILLVLFNFPNRILNAFDLMTPNSSHNKSNSGNVCVDTKIDENLTLFYTKAHRFSLVIVPMLLTLLWNCLLVYELKLNDKGYTPGSTIKDDLKNMAKTLIFISILFIALLATRAIATLVYSSVNNPSSWILTIIQLIDLAYSAYMNSIFFVLVSRNDLFSEEFKNFYMRQQHSSNDLAHI